VPPYVSRCCGEFIVSNLDEWWSGEEKRRKDERAREVIREGKGRG
jgi:hypothetical protein